MDNFMNTELGQSQRDAGHFIIFLIDCSGSMEGKILGSIKNMMEEISCDNDNSNTKILVAQIAEDIQWLNENPAAIQNFAHWRKLSGGSVSNLGLAFSKLSQKLMNYEQNLFVDNVENITFILFSDGMATDHYEEGIAQLKAVDLFREAKRYAINPGGISDESVLMDFTGSQNHIYNMNDRDISTIEKILMNIIYCT